MKPAMNEWPITIALVLILSAGTPLWAAEPEGDKAKPSAPDSLITQMGKKFSRGAANFSLGWIEVPKQIARVSTRSGWVPGLVLGPIQGLGMFVARTVAGAYEVLTFPAPVPLRYQPMIEPEFVWDLDDPTAATSALNGTEPVSPGDSPAVRQARGVPHNP